MKSKTTRIERYNALVYGTGAFLCLYNMLQTPSYFAGQCLGLLLLSILSYIAYPLPKPQWKYNIELPNCKMPDMGCLMSYETIVIFADQAGRITLASDDSILLRTMGIKAMGTEIGTDYPQLGNCISLAKQVKEPKRLLLYADARLSYKVIDTLTKTLVNAGYHRFNLVVSYRPELTRFQYWGWH